MIRWLLILAGFLGFSSVALGALGAHALKTRLLPEMLELFRTAVWYQQIHALALMGVGVWALHRPGRWLQAAGILFVLGVLGFSGTLYVHALWGWHFGLMTPLGGSALMLGWLCVLVTAWRTLK